MALDKFSSKNKRPPEDREDDVKTYDGPLPAHKPQQYPRKIQTYDQPTSVLDPAGDISDPGKPAGSRQAPSRGNETPAPAPRVPLPPMDEENLTFYVEEILKEIRQRQRSEQAAEQAAFEDTAAFPYPPTQPGDSEMTAPIPSEVRPIRERASKKQPVPLPVYEEEEEASPVYEYEEENSPKTPLKLHEYMDDTIEEAFVEQDEPSFSEKYSKLMDPDFVPDEPEEEEETLGFWEKRRLKKEARRQSAREETEGLEPEEESEELEDDYRSPSQTIEIQKTLDSMCSASIGRLILTFILFGLSLYVTVSNYSSTLPSLESLDLSVNPGAYCIFHLITLVLTCLVHFKTLRNGLAGFFTMKANGDSMVSMIGLVGIVFTILVLVRPAPLVGSASVHLYNAVIIAAFLFNSIGKTMRIFRTRRNYGVASSTKEKTALEIVTDQDLETEMIHLLGDPDCLVTVPVKTGFLKRFLELSLDGDDSSTIDRTLAPICFVAALAIAGGSYFLVQSGFIAVTVFVATLCVCAPLSTLLCNNLPLSLASRKLSRIGAFISGNDAMYDFSQTSAITVNASDLFPKGSISLQGLKTFEGGRIDESIIDATSVVYTMGSTLSEMFLNIIENRTDILNEVDTIVYEEEMGVSAWVDGRRVLIGNRDLMQNHGIDVPSRDYENKYKTGSRELIYLATSGVLTAMYIVKYLGEIHIGEQLRKLTGSGVTVIVRTNDPNVTELKVADVFGVSTEHVRVIPERVNGSYERVTRPRPRVDARAGYLGNIMGYLSTIIAAIRLGPTISLVTSLQTIGIVLGYAVITFCAFFSQMGMITPFRLLAYNLFWTACIWLICRFRRF